MHFHNFKPVISRQLAMMQQHPMFRVAESGDKIWNAYLDAFPPGQNEVFRVRREYDCACCRRFVRAVGNAVAAIDGRLVSVWDVTVPDEPAWETVTRAASDLVHASPIAEPFLHYEAQIGADKTFEQLLDKSVRPWEHFSANLKSDLVTKKDLIPSTVGAARTRYETFNRALTEIKFDAIDTVLELIGQNSLYRGAEMKRTVEHLRDHKVAYDALSAQSQRNIYAWVHSHNTITGVRNTAIGTLLVDLSDGVEVDRAVASYEAKVAPANYQRPTAPVTKSMVENAKAKLAELGLTSALERRYATLADVTINNLLFADRSTAKVLGSDVFDEISSAVPVKAKSMERIEEVPVERFLAEVLPRAESLEVLLEDRLQSNLVSLVAPVDPTAAHLFKWSNAFSWSYNGDMADAVKERVKQAGGSVTGDLCVRLAWYNYDDLDIHVHEPDRYTINFRSRGKRSPSGGVQDVDMNVAPSTRQPVENVVYPDRSRMREGVYTVAVNQYNRRETKDVGFEIHLDYLGQVLCFKHEGSLARDSTSIVVSFEYTHAGGIRILNSLPYSQGVGAGRPGIGIWGLHTGVFHRARAVMWSPNHWDGEGVGNKHLFFMLEGCANSSTARGFFNEFLKSELVQHRKVLEMVGNRMKTETAANQLSGLGFSLTQCNTLTCRVKGSFTRTVKVTF